MKNTKIDATITVYKSDDGDYDIYVRDRLAGDPDDALIVLRLDAGKLNLLAALFQLIQTQADGESVTVGADAYLDD